MTKEAIQDTWPHEGTFCFGCGKNNANGLQLKSYWEEDEAVASWTPKDYHLAFPGIVNGGIIATLIDCHGTGTANAAAYRDAGDSPASFMFVTGSLSVRFLKPTPIGEPLTLRARVIEQRERKMTVSCSVYAGGIECATGEVVAIRVDQTRFLH
ncbi:MAG: PaaI family thioesterase [Candidatus Thorarchaeota archaeon]|nr:MAG: PaaI family thioesterase [Candidatus Thorarchaeota archaeon]